MKNLFFITLILSLSGCGEQPGTASSSCTGSYSTNVYSVVSGYSVPTKTISTTYYVSPTGNDDTGDGTNGNPWQSIEKAITTVPTNSNIKLKDGVYNKLELKNYSNPDKKWITVSSETGKNATLKGIEIYNIAYKDSYIQFKSLVIDPDSANKQPLISIYQSDSVEIVDSEIKNSHNKYTADSAIKLSNSKNILIKNNDISRAARGISAVSSHNTTISNNHMHELGGGSGIQYAGGNTNFLVESNNIYDSNFNSADLYAPSDPHGSGISIRSSHLKIRNNVLHNIGSTAGIMFYQPDCAGGQYDYSNIHIENNLLYDIHNLAIIRIYNLGTNITIRNNTIIGHYRSDTANSIYKLGHSLLVQSKAAGHDGSGLNVLNNIFAGIATIPEKSQLKSNIFWSHSKTEDAFNFINTTPTQSTTVMTIAYGDYPITDFTTNFFATITSTDVFNEKHGLTYQFNLDASSPAVNFGDSSNQPDDSLGSIDGNGFIQDDGPARNATKHSAGAYEL